MVVVVVVVVVAGQVNWAAVSERVGGESLHWVSSLSAGQALTDHRSVNITASQTDPGAGWETGTEHNYSNLIVLFPRF